MAKKKKAAKKAVKKKKTTTAKRRPRHKPETLRARQASIGLTVNDIERSIAFYRDIVGFTLGEVWKEQGRLMGAEVKAGELSFWLGQDDWKKGTDRLKGVGVRVYLKTVQDIDAIAERIKSRGGRLDHEPVTQPWGIRDFGMTDPDGYKLTIQKLS